MVSQEPATLNLTVARGSQGLTPQQRAEVIEFAGRYRASDAGNSRLVVSVPSGAPNEVAAMGAAEDVRGSADRRRLPGIGRVGRSISRRKRRPAAAAHRLHALRRRRARTAVTTGRKTSRRIRATSAIRTSAAPVSTILRPWSPTRPTCLGRARWVSATRIAATRSWKHWTKGKVTGSKKSEDERVRVKGAE